MPDTIRKPFPITMATDDSAAADNAFGDDEDTVIIQKKAAEAPKAEPAAAGKAKAKGKKG
jgi:hypothetical protein